MWLLLVVIGVVGLCIPEQFHGQDTLGLVLLLIGAALLVIQVAIAAAALRSIKRQHRAFDSRFRRGF